MEKLLAELQTTFEAFRKKNDERVAALETGRPSAELTATVETMNTAITRLQGEISAAALVAREAQAAAARFVPEGSPEAARVERVEARTFYAYKRQAFVEDVTADEFTAYRAYKAAFSMYLRRGEALESGMKAALQTGSAPDGGFLITPDQSGAIITALRLTSPVREVVSVQSIGTDVLEGTVDLDEASSGWVGETDTRSETDTPDVPFPWRIPVYEQYANPRTTQKMLDDTSFNVEAWLAAKVADKMSRTENTAFVLGTGTNKPRGFATYTAGTPAYTSAAAFFKVRQINSGATGAFTASDPADKFLDIIQAIKKPLRTGAQWAMNSLTLAEVRKMKDGEGRYLLIPDVSILGVTNRLLGYGIQEFEDMADIASASLSIAFANWAQAYQIVDHVVGIRVLRDPYTAKPYIQFYTTKRTGGGILNPQALILMKFSS